MRDKMLNDKQNADPVVMARSCRMRAEEMFTIASTMEQAGPRAILERQAKEWSKLADMAERNAQTLAAAPQIIGKRAQKRAVTDQAFQHLRNLDQQAERAKSQRLQDARKRSEV